jgi:hypothetical protein
VTCNLYVIYSRSSVKASKGGWGKGHASATNNSSSSKDEHKEYMDSIAAFKGKPIRKCTTCTRLQLVEVCVNYYSMHLMHLLI